MLQDLRYALRTFRKRPGTTGLAVVMLALGIGASTVVFSLVESLLLRPLDFADADRLVRIVAEDREVLRQELLKQASLPRRRETILGV